MRRSLTATQVGSATVASVNRRFVAMLVDSLVLVIPLLIARSALGTAAARLAIWVIAIGYWAYFEGGPRGQTLGKRVLKIRVADIQTGASIGRKRGFRRACGKYVSAAVFLLGYFWALWNPQRQTWHDMWANDLVVRA